MANCPTCGKDDYDPSASQAFQERKTVPKWFPNICYLLHQSPNCKEEFKKPLKDWLSRTDLSQKQWKFFCVIHKEVMGKWPPKDDEVVDAPPSKPLPSSMDDIPF